MSSFQIFIVKYVEEVKVIEAKSDVEAWRLARKLLKNTDCEIIGISEIINCTDIKTCT